MSYHKSSPTALHCAILVFLGASCAVPTMLAAGDDSFPDHGRQEPDASKPCVLLRNDNVIFGSARQHGEQVLVERGDGSQIRIDRKRVFCWADSLRNLYQYRLDHRIGSNVQVHLSDARWCLRYGLLEEAGQEVEYLRQLDPTNPQTELLRRQIDGARSDAGKQSQQVNDHDGEQDSSLFASAVTIDDSPVNLVDYESAAISVAPEMLHVFVGQVQPILLNRCGSCHSHTSDREWKLLTPPRGVRTSARMARENYATTIPYMDLSAPETSELLRYALTAHGGGSAPMGPRNALATDTLKRWLHWVAHHQPESSNLTRAADLQDPPETSTATNDETDIVSPTDANDTTALKPPVGDSESERSLHRLPQVENPFDPELFNRKFHRDQAAIGP